MEDNQLTFDGGRAGMLINIPRSSKKLSNSSVPLLLLGFEGSLFELELRLLLLGFEGSLFELELRLLLLGFEGSLFELELRLFGLSWISRDRSLDLSCFHIWSSSCCPSVGSALGWRKSSFAYAVCSPGHVALSWLLLIHHHYLIATYSCSPVALSFPPRLH